MNDEQIEVVELAREVWAMVVEQRLQGCCSLLDCMTGQEFIELFMHRSSCFTNQRCLAAGLAACLEPHYPIKDVSETPK